ncbi:hypothetical protein Nepgr_003648 [Nepenthes gracilis]|uniref:Uncharacterized protein n=1 Tax=Nepenthes gracilis TaxID=150966 RepID=A0AAD3RZW3_NEPGR|nr:hypothetical protein Nepgr_003648 [Nepenthes gracilis]
MDVAENTTMANHVLLSTKELVLALYNYAGQVGDEGSVRDLISYVLAKLKEWFLHLWHFVEQLVCKFDELFPPDTRAEKLYHWLAVATPFLVGALVLFLLFCCCKKCCCGRSVRMMRAPGRGGTLIPRNIFARNPKLYFQNLHAGRSIEEIF